MNSHGPHFYPRSKNGLSEYVGCESCKEVWPCPKTVLTPIEHEMFLAAENLGDDYMFWCVADARLSARGCNVVPPHHHIAIHVTNFLERYRNRPPERPPIDATAWM